MLTRLRLVFLIGLAVSAAAIGLALAGAPTAAGADRGAAKASPLEVSGGGARQEHAGSRCRDRPGAGRWVENSWGYFDWCQRPANWYFEAVDAGYFRKLRWTGWGSKVAVGRGTFKFAYEGIYGEAPAVVRLSGRATNCDGTGTLYQRARMTVDSNVWKPRVSTVRLSAPYCEPG